MPMLDDAIDETLFECYEDAFREHVWRMTVRHAEDRSLWLTNPGTRCWLTPEEGRMTIDHGAIPNNPLQWEVAHVEEGIHDLEASLNNLTARYASWIKRRAELQDDDL